MKVKIGPKEFEIKIVDNWKESFKWYSVQAAIVGGAIISGIFGIKMFGIDVPSYWTEIASFFVITSFVALRFVKQDHKSKPELPCVADNFITDIVEMPEPEIVPEELPSEEVVKAKRRRKNKKINTIEEDSNETNIS